MKRIAGWCNGSTYDSDSYCWGSNPYSAATEKADKHLSLSAFFYQKFISRLRASPPPFSTDPFQCQVYSLTKYYKIGIASLGGEWAARLRPAHSAHTSAAKFLKYPLFAFVLNRCLRAARGAIQNKFSNSLPLRIIFSYYTVVKIFTINFSKYLYYNCKKTQLFQEKK